MKYTKTITTMIAGLTLSVGMANSNTGHQEQQRAMDVYGCQELVRVDKMYPTEIQSSIKAFVSESLSRVLAENPGMKNHKFESLQLTLGQTNEIAEKLSRRAYALSSIAGNLNCPVSYIEDDITTYLFEDAYCGEKVLKTLEGVYGYTVKYLSMNSSCAEDKNHFVIDLFHDLEDF